MKKAQLVSLENNQALTSSRIVADKFDKRHDNIIRDIKGLFDQAGDALKFEGMFHEATYEDKYGRQKPMYLMNRDGFSLLAMGFNGQKALQFKLKFIDEFNRMEAKLKSLAIAGRDDRWLQTRLLGKQTRKLLTQAIKALEEYFEARGKIFPPAISTNT